jgi:hypothetical protein
MPIFNIEIWIAPLAGSRLPASRGGDLGLVIVKLGVMREGLGDEIRGAQLRGNEALRADDGSDGE